MDANLKAGQTAVFRVVGKDRFGNAAPLTGDDAVAFSVDDTTIVSLVDNGDGSGSITSAGPTGTTTLHVADTQTDGDNIVGAAAVLVTAGDVTVLDFEFDAPTDTPTP